MFSVGGDFVEIEIVGRESELFWFKESVCVCCDAKLTTVLTRPSKLDE